MSKCRSVEHAYLPTPGPQSVLARGRRPGRSHGWCNPHRRRPSRSVKASEPAGYTKFEFLDSHARASQAAAKHAAQTKHIQPTIVQHITNPALAQGDDTAPPTAQLLAQHTARDCEDKAPLSAVQPVSSERRWSKAFDTLRHFRHYGRFARPDALNAASTATRHYPTLFDTSSRSRRWSKLSDTLRHFRHYGRLARPDGLNVASTATRHYPTLFDTSRSHV
jgi:hypothetical protein